jgi:hypothetical protein
MSEKSATDCAFTRYAMRNGVRTTQLVDDNITSIIIDVILI